jgi:hypothetical protein
MRWEDQELNHATESIFPEVVIACLMLLGPASRQQGRFLRIDQKTLDDMIESGKLSSRARGARINLVCLYYRLMCRLGPGGDHYPTLGTMHFWQESDSLYGILCLSPMNDWFEVMVVSGEAPNKRAGDEPPLSVSVLT